MAGPERTIIDDVAVMVGSIPPLSLVDGKITEGQATAITNVVAAITQKLNGQISHGSGLTGHRGNFDEQFIDVVTPAVADTEFVIPHGLGRTPVGYEVARADKAASVYDSSAGSWNDKLFMLKCNVASATLKLRVY